jgi:hypothetical protein
MLFVNILLISGLMQRRNYSLNMAQCYELLLGWFSLALLLVKHWKQHKRVLTDPE